MVDSLKTKTLKATLWSGIDSFGIYFVKFGFSIAIARLLIPEDYGLIAMIAIFIGIAGMIGEAGFGMALIQKKEIGQQELSTVFFYKIAIGLIFFVLFFFSSKLIADFFNEPRLVNIVKITGLNFLIAPIGSIHSIILQKELNFKTLAKVNFFVSLVSGPIGLSFAYFGFGVWALVFMNLSSNIFRSITLWFSHRWRPIIVFNIKAFKELFNFGGKIFLLGLIDTIFSNIYYPIIGKKFSSIDLGLYYRANAFYNLTIKQATIAYGRVSFPVLASIQDQEDRLRNFYEKTFKLIMFLFFPIVVALIVSAEPFVRILLTEKWLGSVPFMHLLYINGLFYPLYMLNINTFYSLGKAGFPIKLETIFKISMIISILITLKYGISGLIAGQISSLLIVFFLSNFFINKCLKINFQKVFMDIIPIILAALFCFIISHLIIPKIIANDILLIISQWFTCSILYFLIFRVFSFKIYIELKEVFINYLPQKYRFIF